MKPFSIVFMGTPDFAVAILERLYYAGISIRAVVTVPDKPSGRGQKMQASPVKEFAVANNLPLLQPSNLKDPEFLDALQALQADLFVVVAFRMLPEAVWAMPPRGTINLHGSLLPQYRGAAPIQRAVMNGETRTGVTTFFIEKDIDTGKIIEQASVDIGENETGGEIYDRLMRLGAEVTLSTVRKVEQGEIKGIGQDTLNHTELKPAPKIFKEDCRIDFGSTCAEVHNFCRGLSPYPTAWTLLKNKETGEVRSLKIFRTEKTEIPAKELHADKEALYIACSDFCVKVTELQFEGKKRMPARDFLLGFQADKWELAD